MTPVSSYALQKGYTIQIDEMPDATKTSAAAAESLGCEVGQIAKSIIFTLKENKSLVLVIASGVNRVDKFKIEKELGKEIKLADPEYVEQMTGFKVGGVPPFGHNIKLQTFIDKDLLAFDFVYPSGGSFNTLFKINPKDLVIIAEGKIIDVK